MKKLILILLLLIPLAYAEDFSNSQSLNLNFSISSHLKLSSTSSNSIIKDLTATVTLSPKQDERQKIINYKEYSYPIARISKNKDTILIWDEINSNTVDDIYFNLASDIQTQNTIPKIASKISYPITISGTNAQYIQEASYIDINQNIRNKAQELAQGKSNLHEIVFTIANWTNQNIEYNLNTITAEAIQKSSWVYRNKQGVCDEITNLFISLLRSLKIPAKFVAGTVYSNSINSWGNHGWAEVYFPGYGWIPYDVTLGQYGWIDPSHVKLSESVDSTRPAINYRWKSAGVQVNPSKLDTQTHLKSNNGELIPKISVNIKPLVEKVGFDSYIPVKITVKNLVNYYLTPKIHLSKSPTQKETALFLKPYEKRTLFWVLKLPALNSDYKYTSPIEVTTSLTKPVTSEISISNAYKKLTLEQANKRLNNILTRDSKPRFTDLTISCFPDSSYYYSDSNINIKCTLENKGSKKDLNFCIHDVCQDISLDKTKEINFKTMVSYDIEIFAENERYIKYADIKPEIVQVPDISIINIEPLNIEYNKEIELKFTLTTNHPAKNLKVFLNNQNVYEAENFRQTKDLKIKLNSKSLITGAKFKLTYEDEKGREHKTTAKYLTTIKNSPWYANLISRILQRKPST